MWAHHFSKAGTGRYIGDPDINLIYAIKYGEEIPDIDLNEQYFRYVFRSIHDPALNMDIPFLSRHGVEMTNRKM